MDTPSTNALPEQPRERVVAVQPLDCDPSGMWAGRDLRQGATNDGELSTEDLAAIDAEFGISPEQADAVDVAMHADKQRNGHDARREQVTRQDRVDAERFWRGR